MNILKDTIIDSCLAGTTAFVYKNLTNHFLYYMGITPFLYRVEASTLVLPLGQANSVYGIIIGLFTDFILLNWFALIIAYFLQNTGFDYAILKGAFIGASSWVLIYGFFAHTGLLGLYKPRGIESGLTSIFFDVTMGMVAAYVLLLLKNKAKV